MECLGWPPIYTLEGRDSNTADCNVTGLRFDKVEFLQYATNSDTQFLELQIIMLMQCGGCNAKISVPESAVGKRVQCPGCQRIIRVPPPDAAESKPPAADKIQPKPPPIASEPSTPVDPESFSAEPQPAPKSKPKPSWDDDARNEDDEPPRRRKKRRRDDYDDDDFDDDDDDDFDVRNRRRRPHVGGRPVNGMAMTAMVMGIVSVSVLFAMICCVGMVGAGFLGVVTGIMAVAFGFMGKAPGSEGHAQVGIICGSIAILVGILEFAGGIVLVGLQFN